MYKSKNTMSNWHLYILRTKANALYTGITTDVERRFSQHTNGTGAKALRGKGPLELVFQQSVENRSQALRLEAAVKKLTKTQKQSIVDGTLPLSNLLPSNSN